VSKQGIVLACAAVLALAACGGSGTGSGGGGAPAPLYGRVTKISGTPVGGAVITLQETGEQVAAGSDGRFRMETSFRGLGTITVSSPGYATLRTRVQVGDGQEKLLWLVRPSEYDRDLACKMRFGAPPGQWPDCSSRDPLAGPSWIGPTIVYTVDRSPPWSSRLDPFLKQAEWYWHMVTAGSYQLVEGVADRYILVKASNDPCNLGLLGCAYFTSYGPAVELRPDVGLATVVHEMLHALRFWGHGDRPGGILYPGATYPGLDVEAAIFCTVYGNPQGIRFSQLAPPDPPRCHP